MKTNYSTKLRIKNRFLPMINSKEIISNNPMSKDKFNNQVNTDRRNKIHIQTITIIVLVINKIRLTKVIKRIVRIKQN